MRELPEPDGYYFREDSLYIGGGEDIKTGDYRTETVLAIQKQAYEDGLRDAWKESTDREFGDGFAEYLSTASQKEAK